jgi:hypothetical protein
MLSALKRLRTHHAQIVVFDVVSTVVSTVLVGLALNGHVGGIEETELLQNADVAQVILANATVVETGQVF